MPSAGKCFKWIRCFQAIVLASGLLLSGCSQASSTELYENSEAGISLEMPKNWELSYHERNGMLILVAKSGLWSTASARVEIRGPACLASPGSLRRLNEVVEMDTNRIATLYNLESITIIQGPTTTTIGNYETSKAVIGIPTIALPKDSPRNQMGSQSPEKLQTIEILAMQDAGGYRVIAYIYIGNNDSLNNEARAIVNSIKLICDGGP